MEAGREDFLNGLQAVDAYEFEEFVAELWERQGWETEVTTGSNDRGIDVIATRETPFSQKVAIQAKRYDPENTVGSPDIQQYASLRQQVDNLDAVIIVTTASYTSGAEELAESLNVKLIDGDQLYDLFTEYGDPGLLTEYFQTNTSGGRGDVVPQSGVPQSQPEQSIEPVPSQSDTIDVSPEDTSSDHDEVSTPSSLADVISLGERLSDELTVLSDQVEAADTAFEDRDFGSAIEQYSDAQQELLSIRSRVEIFNEGFSSIDSSAAQHLTGPEEYEVELEKLHNHISDRLTEATELAEQAEALRTLSGEVEKDADNAVDAVEEGDRLRNRGDYDGAIEYYERAAEYIDEAYATLETYQALLTEYPRALPETYPEPPAEINLDEIESKVNDRLSDGDVSQSDEQSAAEAMHQSVQETLLTDTYAGEGYTNEAPESYLEDGEPVHFVFYSEIKGWTKEDSTGSKERLRPDSDYGTVFVITDRRLVIIRGTDAGDKIQEVSLPARSEYSTGWNKNRLSVYPEYTEDSAVYHLWIDAEYDEDDLEAATEHLLTRPDSPAYRLPETDQSSLAESLPSHIHEALRAGIDEDPDNKPYLGFEVPSKDTLALRLLLNTEPRYTVATPDTDLFDRAVVWAEANDYEIEITDADTEEFGTIPKLQVTLSDRDVKTLAASLSYFLDKVCGIATADFDMIEAKLVPLSDDFDADDVREFSAAASEHTVNESEAEQTAETKPTPQRDIDTGTLTTVSTEAKSNRAEELVSEAHHDAVTRTELMESPPSNNKSGNEGLYDDPLINYLNRDESLRYVFSTRGSYGISIGEKGDRIDPSTGARAFHTITDGRVIAVVGQKDGDETVSIPLESIVDAEAHIGISKFRLEINTANETYHLWISNSYDSDDVKKAVSYLS